jgi:acyl-CoA synthetase (AMP-forming)/AMP-acid ligase II
VVLSPGAEVDEAGILAFLDGRIARYKIPRSVLFAAELPRTATGKIAKKTLRQSYGAVCRGAGGQVTGGQVTGGQVTGGQVTG